MVKNLPAVQKAWVLSPGWEDPLEEATETHSSILGWRIPRIEEPGGLKSMGSQRLGHEWVSKHNWCMVGRYGCQGESRPLFWSHVGNQFVGFIPSILCLIFYVSDQIYPKLFYSKALIICYNTVAQWLRTCLPLQEMQETRIWLLGWEDALEKEMSTRSSILAWKIPWTEKPGGLQSTGSQRVGHNWVTEHTVCKELF